MDKDKSGSLSVEEVRDLMGMLGFKSSLEDVAKMVAEIDVDRNGSIDFDEFLVARAPLAPACSFLPPHFVPFLGRCTAQAGRRAALGPALSRAHLETDAAAHPPHTHTPRPRGDRSWPSPRS